MHAFRFFADVNFSAGTATAWNDFIPAASTLEFGNGTVHSISLMIPIIDDDEAEDEEFFTLSLEMQQPADAQVGPNAEICILDNDGKFSARWDQLPYRILGGFIA